MPKADVQPNSDTEPNHIAVDETVIQVNDERHWLYAAVDPDTTRILYARLFQTRTTQLTVLFLRELREQQHVEQRRSSLTGRSTSRVRSTDSASDFRCGATEIGTASNVSFVR